MSRKWGACHGIIVCTINLILTVYLTTQKFEAISKWMGNSYSHTSPNGKFFTRGKTSSYHGINYVSDDGLSIDINELENELKNLKICVHEMARLKCNDVKTTP